MNIEKNKRYQVDNDIVTVTDIEDGYVYFLYEHDSQIFSEVEETAEYSWGELDE